MNQLRHRSVLAEGFGEYYVSYPQYGQVHYMLQTMRTIFSREIGVADWHPDWYGDAKLFTELADMFAA